MQTSGAVTFHGEGTANAKALKQVHACVFKEQRSKVQVAGVVRQREIWVEAGKGYPLGWLKLYKGVWILF